MSALELRGAWRFMLAHAGYSTPPGRAACALELARAERLADALGLELEVQSDPEPGEAPQWNALLLSPAGDTLAVLGGIDAEPGDAYYRVIRAELTAELTPEALELLGPAPGVHVTSGEVAAVLARLRGRAWPGSADRAMSAARGALLGLVLELAHAEDRDR